MQKLSAILIIFLLTIASCNNKKGLPDISGIKADASLERFDKDFFAIDSNNVLPGLNQLAVKYPVLTPIFLQNILGLDSAITLLGVKQFIHQSQFLYDSVNNVFRNTDNIQKEFTQAFRYLKYYFPTYKTPRIITVLGPIDALAQTSSGYTPDFLGADFLGISLQFYLGKDFSLYNDAYFAENVAPAYRSRRFSKEYIVADGMQLIVDDLFPDKSKGKPLIEQMIEKGKQWWLLDQLMPEAPDSIKTGYKQQQLNWCMDNEGLIWNYIIKNEELYSVNPITIQTYIGEGPFTQGFSQELSPGNIGAWIGWQIVKKYASKNPDLQPTAIMTTPPKKILEEGKYRPE